MSKVIVVCVVVMALVCSSGVAPARAGNILLKPDGKTNRVVVVMHGSGGSAENILSPGVRTSTDVFLQRGFAVAASDAYGPQNWGSPESVRANLNMVRRLRLAGYDRVFLIGGSMGGLDTMQMIGRVHPEAVALVAPVCNLRGVPVLDAMVSMQWGDRRPEYLSPVSAEPWVGMPTRIWASPEDTWVPKDRNADFCARELRRDGAKVTFKLGKGDHNNPVPMPGWDHEVPDFFSGVARRAR